MFIGQAYLISEPKFERALQLYLAFYNEDISSILLREDDTLQLRVYYVSKARLEVEIRYPDTEKLALGLIIASRKLRPYFHVHTIFLLISFLPKQVL